MKINAAIALAQYVKEPHEEEIIPSPLDKNVANIIAKNIIRLFLHIYPLVVIIDLKVVL